MPASGAGGARSRRSGGSLPEQDPLALQLRQFCRVIRREEQPLIDGREAMKTLEATLAVKEAAATGKAVSLD